MFDSAEQPNPSMHGAIAQEDPKAPVGVGMHVSLKSQISPAPHPPCVPVKHGSPSEPTVLHVPHVGMDSSPPSSKNGSPVHEALVHWSPSLHGAPAGSVPGTAALHANGRPSALHGHVASASPHAAPRRRSASRATSSQRRNSKRTRLSLWRPRSAAQERCRKHRTAPTRRRTLRIGPRSIGCAGRRRLGLSSARVCDGRCEEERKDTKESSIDQVRLHVSDHAFCAAGAVRSTR